MKSILMSLTLGGLSCMLLACGQKGNLYLPTEPAAQNRATLQQTLLPSPSVPSSHSPTASVPSVTPTR